MAKGNHPRSIRFAAASLTLTMALSLAVPTAAQVSRSDLSPVREAMESGEVMPLGAIIQAVRNTAPYDDMQFLGVVGLDPINLRYKLKFLDGNRVVYVYVDARTGRILGRSR